MVDMRLEDGNGLDVISALKRRRPDARASSNPATFAQAISSTNPTAVIITASPLRILKS